MAKGKDLVIVESPAKARTMSTFLGSKYVIKASLGHVRDLPKSGLGVDVSHGFAPKYTVLKEKASLIKELKGLAQDAPNIYLATDPDREGEAISWHLTEAASLDGGRVKRVVFHEITELAVKEAFKQPRDIDMNLVDAQQARRILDRLVGYKLSPLLWQKLQPGLSAGRVQSATLRMVVEREREIEAFVPVEYWNITAQLTKQGEKLPFKAKLYSLADSKEKLEVPNQAEADRITQDLEGAAYKVAQVTKKSLSRRPAPPFTTSTLQQEAWRKLRFAARKTMFLAQQLYEGLPLGRQGPVGLITYMRTDSFQVSEQALKETRSYIRQRFGEGYLPKRARMFTRKARLAQEAHEAIRPTSPGREPASLGNFLSRDQLALYDLIWKRMVASQMADASLLSTLAEINAASQRSSNEYLFKATGSVVRFPGFLALYTEGRDEGSQDEDSGTLPELEPEESLDCLGLESEQFFTQPPPRYTEASLVKALEENGIGRPSTYAPIISVIQERNYVERDKGRFKPLPLGFLVCDLLTQNFPGVIDLGFTAEMEEKLDDIAQGKRPWVKVLEAFYKPFSQELDKASSAIPDEASDQVCELCGRPMVIKVSRRYGKRFLSCSGYPECKNAKPIPNGAKDEPTDQVCELCDKPMVIKLGRFGKFVACTGYPACKNTKPLLQKTGAHCPECGGDIVERHSKNKKRFYGCSKYPTCDFTTPFKPLPEPCPECGGLLVSSGRRGSRCLRCAYKGRAESQEPAGVEA